MNRTLLSLALDAQAQTINGLCAYLEYQVMSRSMAPRHCYFLPDGRYLNNAPIGELTPQGLELACAKYPSACGKYTLASNKLNLSSLKGKPWTADFKPSATPGHLDSDNIPCQKVTASYPASAKRNGRYTPGSVSSSAQSATYRLAANSLELSSNGQTSKHLIYELPAGADKIPPGPTR